MRPLLRALAALTLLALAALPAAADEPRGEPGLHPAFDLRLREEVLNDLYTFDPVEPDRDWIRLRTRAGLAYGWGDAHELEARLCSEFRKIRTPDTPLNYDEIILDRLLYRYRPSTWATLTLGRQDIAWDDGFLVMDGTPLDGSRSAYMNALRLAFEDDAQSRDPMLTELFVAHNPAYDDLVLWDDDVERRLTDGDETAAALRLRVWHQQQFALIWKRERDPDHRRPALDAWTLGYRGERRCGQISLMGELALQHQDWTGLGADTRGLAWAMQTRLRRTYSRSTHADLGLFGYSGRDGDQLPFRTPWGRWPKWSELMLYRLIGEGGVGAWANLAGSWIDFEHGGSSGVLGLGAQLLLAPDPGWTYRGLLLRLRLERNLGRGLTAQILIEQFGFLIGDNTFTYSPAYGDAADLSIEKRSGHFLRLQFNYELK